MQAGLLNSRVEIWHFSETTDEVGATVQQWAVFCACGQISAIFQVAKP